MTVLDKKIDFRSKKFWEAVKDEDPTKSWIHKVALRRYMARKCINR